MKNALRWLVGLTVALFVIAPGMTAWATPAEQLTVTNGMVVVLQGTPHLFIGDDQGALHWGGDTRGLANQFIDWGTRREVTLDQLRTFRRNDPYLSAGLLKIGDPIYLVKWETNQSTPSLLRIQSISDVELFGINATNYGNFVMDKTTWEQRFGLNSDSFPRGELVPATTPAATPTPLATATPSIRLTANLVEVKRTGQNEYSTKVEITNAMPPKSGLTVSAKTLEYNCQTTCATDASTTPRSWGPVAIGPTDLNGKLVWTDVHGPYRSYTYTFTDPAGNTTSLTVSDDVDRNLVAP